MKVLVIGGGGREHAMAWRLSKDAVPPELFCAPGNAGTAEIATNLDVGAEDIDSLVAWAKENRPDLVAVGPEAPLCAGITDRLEAEGIRVFGPSREAAQLEGSKTFAKEIMITAGVPTAVCSTFTDPDLALEYVRDLGLPVVVKADGLAAGKGVAVCTSFGEAEKAVRECLVDNRFGSAGNTVLIEECLIGEEASILALVDGEHVVMLASSQDHKRAYDGDEGPNTGGMGAYSPAPIVTDDLWPVIRDEVFGRTLHELKKRGIVYKGVLYAGVMMTDAGPKVLEFNCRFGDPETQCVLPRLKGDFLSMMQACVDGTLRDEMVQWKPEACACVVMASGGYPGSYEKEKPISGLKAASVLDGVFVFHAGTKQQGGDVVTSGGRVLGVTGLGDGLPDAVGRAYEAIARIGFAGAEFRMDIARKAM